MTATKNTLTLKTGGTIPKGTQIVAWNVGGRPNLCEVAGGYKVRVTSCLKMPSIKTLEKWCDEGIAKTPSGKRVEPDGYGNDGSPSWLLVAGLI